MRTIILAAALAVVTLSGAAAHVGGLEGNGASPYLAGSGLTPHASQQVASADVAPHRAGSIIVECHPARIPSGLFTPKGAALPVMARPVLDAAGSSGSQFCWIGGTAQMPTQ